jgi:hypothetical protein
MSLFIENIGNLPIDKLEDSFDEKFGAVVFAEQQVISFLCHKKRQAIIYVTTSSEDLRTFIRIIERNGTNTLVIQGVAYTVRLTNLSLV